MSRISKAIRAAKSRGGPAIVAYLTAGFPTKAAFLPQLNAIGEVADVIEIGVPFTDPMADGTTIQRSSRIALEQGVSLRWIFDQLASASRKPQAPLLLMSYLNPLLAYGMDRLAEHSVRAGITGFIVPDLPYEECTDLRASLSASDIALVQFVTPVTPIERAKVLSEASQGFLYAVTMTGTTGKNVAVPQEVLDYFSRVRELSPVPLCAGFGIRSREQVSRLAPHVDGVIVGSALVEVLERGEDPVAWLEKPAPAMTAASVDHGRQWTLAALLASLAMISPFSIDTFFPSFRAISAEFHLTEWQIQQTLTVYMLPYAVMVLLHGPISDAVGRRPVVLVGISLYALASLACAFAPNFAMLLVFRAVQGMTAGTGLVIGRAIVRDLHEGPQAQRLMSVITMIFGIAPAIAPVIGGWIHVALGWRSVFGFMVFIGLALVLASWVRLPETHPQANRLPLDRRRLVSTAWGIASDRRFLPLALCGGLNFATMLVFVGAAPAIVLDHWHLTETQFAYLFVPFIAGFTLGAALSGRLAGRIAAARQVAAGFVVSLGGTAFMTLLHASVAEPPIVLQQLALLIYATGIQLVFPVVTLRMLDLFPAARGSAASVQSFAALVVASVVIGFIVPMLSHSLLALGAGSFTLAFAAFVCWRIACRAM